MGLSHPIESFPPFPVLPQSLTLHIPLYFVLFYFIGRAISGVPVCIYISEMYTDTHLKNLLNY